MADMNWPDATNPETLSRISAEVERRKTLATKMDSGSIHLEGTYLRLAQGAQELGLDDEDVDTILAIYAKHKQKNQ